MIFSELKNPRAEMWEEDGKLYLSIKGNAKNIDGIILQGDEFEVDFLKINLNEVSLSVLSDGNNPSIRQHVLSFPLCSDENGDVIKFQE